MHALFVAKKLFMRSQFVGKCSSCGVFSGMQSTEAAIELPIELHLLNNGIFSREKSW